jgi:hypothetical protein
MAGNGVIFMLPALRRQPRELQGGAAFAQRAMIGLLAVIGRHDADRAVGNVASLRRAPHQP